MPVRRNSKPKQPHSANRYAGLAGTAAAALLLAVAFGTPVLAQAASPNVTQQVQHEINIPLPSLAPLVERVSPAVVNVSAELSEQAAAQEGSSTGNSDEGFPQSPFDQMLRRFFEDRLHPHERVTALGSGFIIDPRGYVVTNNHVVGNAAKVTVIMQDGSRHDGRILGRDDKTDIALLKIDAGDKLPFVDWGNSDAAKVGDWVVAVGNPFGLGGTVTAGIVSALGRNINEGPYDDFLQIDAPINRGNSGGPTFNLSGQVIGINTAIYSPSGGSVGIGFAIPSNIGRQVVDQLEKTGHVTRGWLGVSIQSITPSIAKSLGLSSSAGALVASVTPDSPAAKVGLKSGDVITAIEGHPIKEVHDLPRIVAAAPVGKSLSLTVRRGGKEMTLAPVIAELKPEQEQQASAQGAQGLSGEGTAAALGVELANLDATLRSRLHVPKDVTGVVVRRIDADSPLASLAIQPGDVIVSVDQKPATTPRDAATLLNQAAASGNVLLLLNRHGASEFVGLSIHPGNPRG
jgi:serine protease Do